MRARYFVTGRTTVAGLIPVMAMLLLGACHRDMYEEPKILPDQQNYYFPNQPADRQPPAHTVSRDAIEEDTPFSTGQTNGALATGFPVPPSAEMLARGREEFEINCSACHGRDGYGQGMVVQRGFPAPPSFHSDRLRDAPVGHFYEVITDGYGAMYPFGSRIGPADRWAIISYIRALQFSQHAPVTLLEPQDQSRLGRTP